MITFLYNRPVSESLSHPLGRFICRLCNHKNTDDDNSNSNIVLRMVTSAAVTIRRTKSATAIMLTIIRPVMLVAIIIKNRNPSLGSWAPSYIRVILGFYWGYQGYIRVIVGLILGLYWGFFRVI